MLLAPNTTFFVLVPAPSLTTRMVNRSLSLRQSDITRLAGGDYLLEVPAEYSADFVDFEWFDAAAARSLVADVGYLEASVSRWSRLRNFLSRSLPRIEAKSSQSEEIA